MSIRTVNLLLRHLLLSDVTDGGGTRRFVVNGTGRAVVCRPGLADKILPALLMGRSFTVVGDRVVFLGDGRAVPDPQGLR